MVPRPAGWYPWCTVAAVETRGHLMSFADYWNVVVSYVHARFDLNERGAALVEYALLLALIAIVCILALTTLGAKASSKFASIADKL